MNERRETLKQPEVEQVEKRTAPRAVVIYAAIRREGEDELARPSSALFWSGLAAGLSMGFSLVTEGLLRSYLPEAPWQVLISKFGYSIGFLIVILGRQQLFTENTLTPVLPLLHSPSVETLLQMLRLWCIVLVANLSGAFIFAFVVGHTTVYDESVRSAFTQLSLEVIHRDFQSTLLKAIFAGWLIALMVWLLPMAEAARIWIIIILTYLIGLGKLAHVVAGSTEAFYAVLTAGASWADFFLRFFIPTLIGNVIGGISLVAAINHAQVAAGTSKLDIDF